MNSGRRCYHRIDIIFESEWGYYLYNDNEQASKRASEREHMNAAEAQLLFTFENRQTVAASICWCYGCRSIISIIFSLYIFFYSMEYATVAFSSFFCLSIIFSSLPQPQFAWMRKKNVQNQQKFVAVQNEVRMNHLFILRSIFF